MLFIKKSTFGELFILISTKTKTTGYTITSTILTKKTHGSLHIFLFKI